MLWRSQLVRSSSVYVASNVLNRALPFLLLPVLTRYLTPTDFGTAAMFTLAVNLYLPLVGLNTDGAIGRQYFERDRLDFPRYIGTCLLVLAVTAVLVAAANALAGRSLATYLAVPAPWLWAALLVAVGRYLSNVALVLWQVRQRARSYAVFSFVQSGLSLLLSILFVVGLGYGWTGRALGEMVSVTALALVGLALLVRGGWVRSGVDRDHLAHALKFGGGLVPHLYGSIMIATTDRLMVTNLVGLHATGLYAVGAQVAMVIGVLEQSVNQAWAPWLFGKLREGTPANFRRIRRITRIYNVSILGLAGLLALVAPALLRLLVGPEFYPAAEFVAWLALASAFSGMYKMVVNQIFYANKTHWLAWITFATGVVNLPVTYLLIRANGALGAAQGTAMAYFMSYACTAVLSARVTRELQPNA